MRKQLTSSPQLPLSHRSMTMRAGCWCLCGERGNIRWRPDNQVLFCSKCARASTWTLLNGLAFASNAMPIILVSPHIGNEQYLFQFKDKFEWLFRSQSVHFVHLLSGSRFRIRWRWHSKTRWLRIFFCIDIAFTFCLQYIQWRFNREKFDLNEVKIPTL